MKVHQSGKLARGRPVAAVQLHTGRIDPIHFCKSSIQQRYFSRRNALPPVQAAAPAKGKVVVKDFKKDGPIHVLISDVGGTNARIQLWKVEEIDGIRVQSPIFSKEEQTKSFPTYEDCLESFLASPECLKLRPDVAAVAVAGPVVDQTCKMTNINWFISKPVLESKFNCRVTILNDFEAIGYGIPVIDPNDIVALNEAGVRPRAPIAVLGPGTGLGECQLFWDESRGGYKVYPSEGSHADFAPRGPLQRDLASWVEGREGFCEVEHVACGKGLERIAEFLTERRGLPPRPLSPSEVSSLGLKGDKICSEALDLFLAIVGAEAGHMALRSLAGGGVYIAGGIPAKVIERVTGGAVLSAFVNESNPKFSGILKATPLFVVRDPGVGLKGALEVAVKSLTLVGQ